MGLLDKLSVWLGRGKTEVTVLVLGLDNSGKSTLLNTLRPPEQRLPHVTPTVAHQQDHFQSGGVSFSAWDVSGAPRHRALWERHYRRAHALIFVVDSADHLRLVVVGSGGARGAGAGAGAPGRVRAARAAARVRQQVRRAARARAHADRLRVGLGARIGQAVAHLRVECAVGRRAAGRRRLARAPAAGRAPAALTAAAAVTVTTATTATTTDILSHGPHTHSLRHVAFFYFTNDTPIYN
ncbi:uncharacterized protein LOC113519207 isoform X1 [Galleria mellonella]|uniref:Uncharacterized protein LOC113519207 isoform X1 n=1 Tax=Galleria mellonella TaxID=7137 RepID=A0A6J3CAI7_GALME|nr:uncharacterized protein LOC113519207 isoform X1 [Galleria mellonella]